MSQIPFRVRHSCVLLLGMTILLFSGCSGDGGGTGGSTGAACQSNCPTAQAGPEQAVLTGDAVTLDGSGSTSGTPGLITYHWTLLSKPAGSAATLASATTARPTFTADVAGTYAAQLVVQEGGASSPPAMVTITCGSGNLAPIANAGLDRTERLGTPFTLDGTGSGDPNGTPLTYAWKVVTQPAGSQAVLVSATTKTPSFTPQVAGLYTFALTVKDGTLTSPSDEVMITVTNDNCPPIANAGPDRDSPDGEVVTLTGAGSTDPNDDPLTYSWRFQSKPDGSTATLAAPTAVSPTFTPDRIGLYVLSLTVSDGRLTSAPDMVVINVFLNGSAESPVFQAYLKPSNPFGGTRDIPEFFPGNQFGFSIATSGNTIAVGAPTENSCAPGINGDQTNHDCQGAGAVYVFTRTAGVWAQQAYVKGSNPSNPSGGTVDEGFHNAFGTSVALSGDTLAVGVPGDSGCGVGVNGDPVASSVFGCRLSGAVFIFTRTNGSWTQQAYVKASTRIGPSSQFGQLLALSGDTLAVGSARNGVYVFTRAAGIWSQQAIINKASNTEAEDRFGSSIALSGETLAIGAPGEASCARGINGDQINNACPSAGAMYVFRRTAGVWNQQAYVKASNTQGGDAFGSSVALAGETLAVGDAGGVSVFMRTNGIWAQDGSVTPDRGASSLGQTLALNDDLLVVGEPGEVGDFDGVVRERAGAVYIFHRFAPGIWSGVSYMLAPNTDAEDRFGTSVALSPEMLAIGAPLESSCAAGVNGNQADNNCYAAGAAYAYEQQ